MVAKSSTNRGRVRAARAKAAEKYRQRRLQRGIWPKGNPWLTQVESSFIQVNYWIIWIRTKVSVGQNHCESIYCFLFSVLPSLFFTFHLISPLILIYIFIFRFWFCFDSFSMLNDKYMMAKCKKGTSLNMIILTAHEGNTIDKWEWHFHRRMKKWKW